MVKHKSHLFGFFGHRLGRNGGPGEIALVGCLEQRPLTNILGEQGLHDFGKLGHDLGVQFRVVNSPVGRADGDCPGIVERTDSGHLHNGNLSIFGHRKLRPSKFECRIVILDA